MDKSVCIFGDSVVEASYIRESWPLLLRNHLEKKYKEDFVGVYNLGIGGNTTDDILARIENESKYRGPTSIIIAVGVNDSGYFRVPTKPIVEKEKFKSNLTKIIEIARKFTDDITIVGLAIGDDSLLQPFPGSSQGKSYMATRTKDYDNLLKKVAEDKGCKYVYLFEKLGLEDFSDGLHPNESGHRKIFEEIKKHL